MRHAHLLLACASQTATAALAATADAIKDIKVVRTIRDRKTIYTAS